MNIIQYDVIIIGSGAAGMIAAIQAAKDGKSVLICEQQKNLGPKLKATGGGKCNLSNTLSNNDFMNSFGRNGKFMMQALTLFDHKTLIDFLKQIGVDTHIPDGFRIFPVTHNSSTIISALEDELNHQKVNIKINTKVLSLLFENEKLLGVKTLENEIEHDYYCENVIIATGGLGFPSLGANGDGYTFAKDLGHQITDLHPAMLPVYTKETWVKECKADTIAKAIIKIDLKKAKKLKAVGDLIFTSKGLRGPVILDFSREITPYLEQYKEVPLLINMLKGMNEEDLRVHIIKTTKEDSSISIIKTLEKLLPESVIVQLCKQVKVDANTSFKKLQGKIRDDLIKILVCTPLTVIDHVGFKQAMITRGGVKLKEINPNTMQSKLVNGLYFCGEVMDLDGPCGGYNLQWSFASGNLAGQLLN